MGLFCARIYSHVWTRRIRKNARTAEDDIYCCRRSCFSARSISNRYGGSLCSVTCVLQIPSYPLSFPEYFSGRCRVTIGQRVVRLIAGRDFESNSCPLVPSAIQPHLGVGRSIAQRERFC
jgi:hypothetical protein